MGIHARCILDLLVGHRVGEDIFVGLIEGGDVGSSRGCGNALHEHGAARGAQG